MIISPAAEAPQASNGWSGNSIHTLSTIIHWYF